MMHAYGSTCPTGVFEMKRFCPETPVRMHAMNAIRRFLLQRVRRRQLSLLAALALLLVRALLPGGVMLDPASVTEGDFSLVICSGHGPMFAHDSGAKAVRTGFAPMTDMVRMTDTTPDDMPMPGMSGLPAHDTMTPDDGLCPFSAALVVACCGMALMLVLFVLMRVTQAWTLPDARSPVGRRHHLLPLSRAPPVIS
jgi:hypothetical protein